MLNTDKVFSVVSVLVMLIFIKPLYGQVEIAHNSIEDTLIINAIELTRIDYKIQIAINYHILFINHKFASCNKDKQLIWIVIDVPFPKRDESIYNLQYSNFDFSKFKESDFDPPYRIGIRLMHRKSQSNFGYLNFKRVYYYNYCGWDVFFVTELPIEFENFGKVMTFQLPITRVHKEREFSYEGSLYEISNYFVTQIAYNYIHGYGQDYNTDGIPYLEPYSLTKKKLRKVNIRRIKSRLDTGD